jgi:hypothetical protein
MKKHNQAMDWNAHQRGAFWHDLFCSDQIGFVAL